MRLKFELAYYDVTIQHFSSYNMYTLSLSFTLCLSLLPSQSPSLSLSLSHSFAGNAWNHITMYKVLLNKFDITIWKPKIV